MSNLNNACIFTLGTYKAVYEIEEIDAKQKIWKGRPVSLPINDSKGKPKMMQPNLTSWLFFSRMFNDENDWDRYYPEIVFDDESILGVPFLLVPKEKQLFGYEPPTDGIVLPGQQVIGAEN